PFVSHTGRQHLAADFFHLFDALAGRHARLGGAQDRSSGIHVVAADVDGTADLLDVQHGPQRHHLAAVVAYFQQLDTARIVAELAVGLDVDLPGSAEKVEIVDVKGAQKRLKRIKYVLRIDAHRLALIAVKVHVQLRHIGAEYTKEVFDFVAFSRPVDHTLDLLFELADAVVAAVLNDDLESTGRAEAGNRRRRPDRHLRFGNLLLQTG